MKLLTIRHVHGRLRPAFVHLHSSFKAKSLEKSLHPSFKLAKINVQNKSWNKNWLIRYVQPFNPCLLMQMQK